MTSTVDLMRKYADILRDETLVESRTKKVSSLLESAEGAVGRINAQLKAGKQLPFDGAQLKNIVWSIGVAKALADSGLKNQALGDVLDQFEDSASGPMSQKLMTWAGSRDFAQKFPDLKNQIDMAIAAYEQRDAKQLITILGQLQTGIRMAATKLKTPNQQVAGQQAPATA